MANMSMGDRNAMERAAAGNEAMLRTGKTGSRVATSYVVVGLLIFAALSYAAIEAIHGWDHIIVIADIVILVVALAVFLRHSDDSNELQG